MDWKLRGCVDPGAEGIDEFSGKFGVFGNLFFLVKFKAIFHGV